MKIMLHSNAPWAATGYGNQCAVFAQQFKEAGHDVAVTAFYGLNGSRLDWNGITIYPGGADAYANDVYTAHAAHFFQDSPETGGLTISLVDAWILNPHTAARANHACWAPVDHATVPPGVRQFFEASGSTCIAMSRFGQKAFEEAGIKADYVPHGIDTDHFKPMNRKEARAALGIEDGVFVVGMVAANKGEPSRKAFAETLMAFKKFREKHSDAVIYLHTDAAGVNQGVNLPDLVTHLELPREAIMWVDPYQYQGLGCPPGHMTAAYNAMDVLINPAYGEGFGIPVIEAQACGTPVIVQDFTAMSEVGAVGWQVGGQPFWTAQRAFQQIPNVDELVDALEQAYDGAGKKRNAARKHALAYDQKTVMDEHWTPLLNREEIKLAKGAVEAGGLTVIGGEPGIEVVA